jgi:glycolate oxidase iron-sulfur subunit
VQYGELVMPFRAYAGERVPARPMERLQRTLASSTLPHPRRFRLAAAAGRMARPVQRLLPAELQAMLDLLPDRLPEARPLPEFMPAEGPRRARVALLAGCVQQALAPQINWATLRVLAKNGVEVVIPAGQGCCGALQIHSGDRTGARRMARRNLKAFPQNVDVILTNAAGCGSGMHEYPGLFAGQKDAAEISEFAAKAQDVSVFLDALGLLPPPPLPQPVRVAYHDACHLSNAQGVTSPPRRLLAAIPGLTLAEVPDGVYCCGSAGSYNFEQPQIAAELGRRKARSILGLGVDMVAAGNIGCLTQIRTHLLGEGSSLPVLHTIELLDLAYRPTGRSQ